RSQRSDQQNGPEPPPPTDQDAPPPHAYENEAERDEEDAKRLQEARASVADLPERAIGDPGAPFEPETLKALALIRARDFVAWARLKQTLQDSGVRLRDLDTAMRGHKPPEAQTQKRCFRRTEARGESRDLCCSQGTDLR
ncbi:hypothetical protein ACFL6C_03370, partial [Myxococcota bacterium]